MSNSISNSPFSCFVDDISTINVGDPMPFHIPLFDDKPPEERKETMYQPVIISKIDYQENKEPNIVHEKFHSSAECKRSIIDSIDPKCVATPAKRSRRRSERFRCPICDLYCTRIENLETHMTKQHGKKDFVCDKCDRVFSNHLSLRKHTRKSMARGRCKSTPGPSKKP